jgi:flavin reductase (DIM6/NTAB) family NADH-FMN oxidoreductase RutF
VVHLLHLGSHYLAIGEILETYISEDCLTNGEPDVTKVNPISYIEGQPGDYYCLGEKVGKAFQKAKKFKKK